MSGDSAVSSVRQVIDLLDGGDLDRLEPLLSPTVRFRSPPHVVQFPGNVISYLKRERQRMPDLRLLPRAVFADADGSRVAATVLWSHGRLTAQVCLVFALVNGRIDEIELFGGLGRILYDVGIRGAA